MNRLTKVEQARRNVNAILNYIKLRNVDDGYIEQRTSIGSVVRDLLAEWKELPRSKREKYRDLMPKPNEKANFIEPYLKTIKNEKKPS